MWISRHFWGKGIYSSSLELELLLLLQPFHPCLCLCLNIFLGLRGLTFLSKAAPARAPAPTANPLPRLPLIGIGRLDLCLGYPPWDTKCVPTACPGYAAPGGGY
uniref:Putative secreted protein n=1 Tax=Ixodes ricinus TaxID=34613 RepID=A0A6B0U811_IXORI